MDENKIRRCRYCNDVLKTEYDIDIDENQQYAYSHTSLQDCIEILYNAEITANQLIVCLYEQINSIQTDYQAKLTILEKENLRLREACNRVIALLEGTESARFIREQLDL